MTTSGAASHERQKKQQQEQLRARLADPGFTPSVRAIGDLLDLVADDDEDVAKAAERAILRIEAQYAARVAKAAIERVESSVRPARARLAFLAGRLAAAPEKKGETSRDPEGLALAFLVRALGDDDPKTRRTAARALGKVTRTAEVEAALAAAFDRATNDDDKKAIALSLGKVGGEAARARLEGGAHARASLLLERETARASDRGSIDTTRAYPDAPLRLWFHTRSGLEDVVKEELALRSFTSAAGAAPPKFVMPGIIEGTLAANAPLAHAARIRTTTHIGFPLDVVPSVALRGGKDDDEKLAKAIVRALTSTEAMRVFRTFTARTSTEKEAPIRFRIAFVKGGHRRALVWRCAELVHEATRALVNDPKDSTWEVVINEVPSAAGSSAGSVDLRIELVPRGMVDERFTYREELVPASSHPTIAAALARVAPFDTEDVVWDPFAGAGAELVERARLGPFKRLIGTDIDPKAVRAAQHNLEKAGLDLGAPNIVIEQGDATSFTGAQGVTLILTNLPMGLRVERGTHQGLLERFVSHAAHVLVPGGALVWLVPAPQEKIFDRAKKDGLDLVRSFSVDMGGFSAELCVFRKRAGAKPTPGPRGNPGRRIISTGFSPRKKPKPRPDE